MDKEQAKKMHEALVGPRLHCECCGYNKVLSPCYFCQAEGDELGERFCFGCGYRFKRFLRGIRLSLGICECKYEVCKALSNKKILIKINDLVESVNINFSGNKLKELPAEIGKLANLKGLVIGDNQLIKLPLEIGYLKNLKHLALFNNRLTTLPSEIGKLVNLEKLFLEHNQIAKLPAEIGKLTNLKYLDLRNNQLSESQIQELKKALPNCEIYA